ncbi:hypothetical protein PENSPDRAFT_711599 [Peniophora sp. CONT]|nr:hypothetical protein PENSPDRAFT_711599 [Peniophora sp. CONT]
MLEKPSFEDTLDALELSLYRVRIAAQKTVNEKLPSATQQLARLRVERIETEIDQLRRRADESTASEVDPTLDLLQIELIDKKIDKASLEANEASQAEQDTADLEVGYVTLQITQHLKRVQRASASNATAPPSSSDAQASSIVAAPAVAASSFPEQTMGADLAAAFVAPRAAPFPLDMRLASPTPTASSNHASLEAALNVDPPIDLHSATNNNGASIASVLSSTPPPQDERAQSPAHLPDDDALDAGDIERQLTGDRDADGVTVKIEPQPLHRTPTATQYIDIDDDGTARNMTPLPVPSDSISASDHDENGDNSSDEADEFSFPLSGSPRAPKSVQAAKMSASATPTKTSVSISSSKNSAQESPSKKPARASPSKSTISARSAPAATQSKKKTGGRKEPVTEPERWAYRLHNFGAVILQEACDWPEETCRVASLLWAEVFVWEHLNKFESGALKAPSLPASIGTILSKSRFGPTPVGVYDKAPDFLRQLAVCLEAIRDSRFADVRQMHGLHGLAVVARSLLEARRSREDFDKLFRPLALEMTAILEALSAASPTSTHTGVVDGSNVNTAVVGGTILAVLRARANYDVNVATAALDILQGRASKGKGKKRDASHMDAPKAGPSKQAKHAEEWDIFYYIILVRMVAYDPLYALVPVLACITYKAQISALQQFGNAFPRNRSQAKLVVSLHRTVECDATVRFNCPMGDMNPSHVNKNLSDAALREITDTRRGLMLIALQGQHLRPRTSISRSSYATVPLPGINAVMSFGACCYWAVYTILVELLTYYFDSPVRWIEKQNRCCTFGHFIEIGSVTMLETVYEAWDDSLCYSASFTATQSSPRTSSRLIPRPLLPPVAVAAPLAAHLAPSQPSRMFQSRLWASWPSVPRSSRMGISEVSFGKERQANSPARVSRRPCPEFALLQAKGEELPLEESEAFGMRASLRTHYADLPDLLCRATTNCRDSFWRDSNWRDPSGILSGEILSGGHPGRLLSGEILSGGHLAGYYLAGF